MKMSKGIHNQSHLKEMEVMNEVAVVKKMVPEILKDVAPTVLQAAEPICEAITQYGCRNQKAICNVVQNVVPEFSNVSKQFFDYVFKILELTEGAINQACEKELTEILENEQLDIHKKIEQGTELIEKMQENKREDQKFIKDMQILKVGGEVVIVVAVGVICVMAKKDNMFTSLNKDWQKTIRTGKRMDMLKNIFGKK